MTYHRALAPVMACSMLAVAVFAPARQQSQQCQLDQELRTKIQPLLNKYCVSCHGGAKPTAGLALDKGVSSQSVAKNSELWARLVFNVKSLSMPPSDPKPNETERQLILDWALRAMSSDCNLADAGHVTIRRLNRHEYARTIHDLLGVGLDLSESFPSDDVGNGFDNIGDVLTISPLLLEKYLAAAEKATTAAIQTPGATTFSVEFEKYQLATGMNVNGDGVLEMFSASEMTQRIPINGYGKHVIKITAYGDQAGPDPPMMKVSWNYKVVDTIPVRATLAKPVVYEVPIDADPTEPNVLDVAFTNDYYMPNDPDPKNRDRNLFISHIDVFRPATLVPLPNGPITAVPKNAQDFETPKQQLESFATRAYRRPLQPSESERLLKLYQEFSKAGSYEQAMRECISAVLTSPKFLFRSELDSNGKQDELVGDYEIASRLSYFLWGSMPDDDLFKQASVGHLNDPKNLEKQIDRMLLSPKAANLSDDFAVQWLQLRKLDNVSPDPSLFPEFDDDLRHDMLTEAQLTFMSDVKENRSVLDLVDSKFAYLNDRLAKLYGVPGVSGNEFRKVDLKDGRRGGLIGMAGILTVTSNPNRTSPVKRGKWILENLLGTPPPPPMPNVGILIDDTAINPTLPMKERLALHRKNPDCATCHRSMDAMGFSLENFDPIGRWRTKDGKFDVDPNGELADGTKVSGPSDLRKLVLSRKRDFVRCLAEKMLTYATGRGLRPQDACHVTKIVDATIKGGYKMHALINAVVQSDPFRKRSPQPAVN